MAELQQTAPRSPERDRRTAHAWWWLGGVGAVALVAMAVGAAVVLALGDGPVAPYPSAGGAGVREPAPDFSFTLYQGQARLGAPTGTVAQLRGRPLVLHFWGAACRSCQNELRQLEELQRRADQRLTVLGVDVGPLIDAGTSREAESLLGQHKVTYPVGSPDGADPLAQYRLRRLPATVFIDRQGKVFFWWVGPLSRDQLIGIAAAMLKEDARRVD